MKRWIEERAKKLFFSSLKNLRGGFLEIVCPEETYVFGEPGAGLRAMAVIHDERFFVRAVTAADIGIGESFMDGDWTSPDVVALVRLCVRNLRTLDSQHRLLSAIRALASRIRHRFRSNTVTGSRENIRAHYDLGNYFYQLFLDAQMLYSSAYFCNATDSLELAQTHKLEMICRKLQIEPGDRVLEIGCGWGGFAMHAARQYGARVTAVTISKAQYEFAAERLARRGAGRGEVRFLLQDYRTLEGEFDKIASIEMFEAVGFAHYDEFFSACNRLLARDGAMLLQTITLTEQEVSAYRKRVDWIQTYIFPGSELASVAEIQRSLGRCTEMALTHMESLGMHYAKTLALWRGRFFEQLESVRRLGFDERFARMWDFYLAWCEGAFRERYINVAQLFLAKHNTRRPLLGDPVISESAISL
ncbi:MAG TPA: cyclopropane-fatty-acyl-phospholipid synthase family protein [Candidatus Dormibacteraeota bacterium]|nr:cyclopropane-fatty-acyl-phospholipid synthase family protein [Candidatus Dormibacteraeota bacterium]